MLRVHKKYLYSEKLKIRVWHMKKMKMFPWINSNNIMSKPTDSLLMSNNLIRKLYSSCANIWKFRAVPTFWHENSIFRTFFLCFNAGKKKESFLLVPISVLFPVIYPVLAHCQLTHKEDNFLLLFYFSKFVLSFFSSFLFCVFWCCYCDSSRTSFSFESINFNCDKTVDFM